MGSEGLGQERYDFPVSREPQSLGGNLRLARDDPKIRFDVDHVRAWLILGRVDCMGLFRKQRETRRILIFYIFLSSAAFLVDG